MLVSKINKIYEIHNKSRICQGDLLKDLTVYQIQGNESKEVIEIIFPYAIIISQDCDLEQCNKISDVNKINQFLPNILVLPAFPSDVVKEGSHLNEIYTITQESIDSKKYKRIKQNNEERYHFIYGFQEIQIPDLLIDFKHYLTVPQAVMKSYYSESYIATLNELFRERLSQRFGNYFCRIGLPEISTVCI